MSSFLVCCSCSSSLILPRPQKADGWDRLRVGGKSGRIAGIAGAELLGRGSAVLRSGAGARLSFVGGTRIVLRSGAAPVVVRRGGFRAPMASGFMTSQIASTAFTWGTVAVLPFYTLMVAAPNAAYTKRIMESSTPYIILGVLYAYLLYLSWTPETIRLMFASKYWLPELTGIAKMFNNEMTLASAWIHLLAVDLFAARQVFNDGLKCKVETRHSVSLCLLFCPIGILIHVVTKMLTKAASRSH